jgi:hypothetical protein
MGTLGRLASGIALGTALLLSSGCEDDSDSDFDSFVPEGMTDLRGTWKDYGHKSSDGNITWYWSHLYLDQSGTNIQGAYSFEYYSKGSDYSTLPRISGHLDGDNVYLKWGSSGVTRAFQGTANDDTMNGNLSSSSGNLANDGPATYHHISDENTYDSTSGY